MHTMDRANHHEHRGRTPRKRGLADQQPGGSGDAVSTAKRGSGALPHRDHARQLYREGVKSGMMPSPVQPLSELVHERSAERL
jgi:hypothetical protein